MTQDALALRLARLERQNRLLAAACAVCLLLAVPAAVQLTTGLAHAGSTEPLAELRVRQLVVVDEKGTERVRIGAPLPDISHGKPFKRDGVMAGVLLYDAEGYERGGYVTSNGYANAMLTLDDQHRQHLLFLTEPTGDTTLRLFDRAGNKAEMALDADGSPHLVLQRNGKPAFEAPSPPTGGSNH